MFIVQNHSGKKVPYVLLALIILLTCTAQVYLFKQPFYSISADENARTYEAANKTFSQLLRPSSWLPLHIIINKLGLHARASALLVKTASRFKSDIRIERENVEVNGKSIMGIMMLAAAKGTTVQVTIGGEDEAEAMQALGDLIRDGFGEE